MSVRARSPLSVIRPWLLPLACLAWGGYFAFHAVAGETGLLAWGGYRAERVHLATEQAALTKRKIALEHRVALLDPRHPDPDLADELVREQLDVVRKDEVVVPLRQGD